MVKKSKKIAKSKKSSSKKSIKKCTKKRQPNEYIKFNSGKTKNGKYYRNIFSKEYDEKNKSNMNKSDYLFKKNSYITSKMSLVWKKLKNGEI